MMEKTTEVIMRKAATDRMGVSWSAFSPEDSTPPN